MDRWLDRPGYVALLSFVAGVIVAAIIVSIVFIRTRDGNGNGVVAPATATVPGTAATPPPGTVTPGGPTTTPGVAATNPSAALSAFVREELGADYLGPCPEEPGDGVAQGLCSIELHRDDHLATFLIGPPFSEVTGEALVTRDNGTWSVEFVPLVFGVELAVGAEAVVFGAGSCLNAREAPSASAEVLSCLADGTRAAVVEGPVEAGGATWWRLDGFGWASAEFLAPAP